METKKILVPIDLTTVAKSCVSHAHHIAGRIGAELHLLHLVDKDKELAKGEADLAAFKAEMLAAHGESVVMHTAVRKGKILSDIGAEAEEMKASLVVIGTHGLQGIEYVVGTHAVRIIGTAQVPFIVVQEKGIGPDGYENIIVPIELEAESKQMLSRVAEMAKLFQSTVHLVVPHESDEFLFNALKRNLNFASTYFAQEGIDYTATITRQDSGDLDEATLEVAKEKDGDLIAIMNWHENRVLGIFGSGDTQDIIINKDMRPVLVINPKMVGNFDLFRTTV